MRALIDLRRGLDKARQWAVPLLAIGLILLLSSWVAIGTASDSAESAQASGADSQAPAGAELSKRRSATSNTFALKDGSLETRIYQVPVNYRDDDGDWQPIEEALRETPSGSLSNGDNSFDVHLPEDLDEGSVKVMLDEHWIGQAPLGIDTQAVDLEDGVATYSTQDGTVDIEFSGLADGLKETIELSEPFAPSTYHFRLEASAGVVPTLEEDGSIEFRAEDGDLIAEVPAPFMVDASDAVAPTGAVKYALSPHGPNGWRLSVEADPEWLNASDRSWPVEIDPSVTVPAPALDCFISTDSGSNPQCGTSGWSYLVAKAKYPTTGADSFARTLLRFNTSAIPKTASVASATIGLYSGKTASSVTKVEMHEVTTDWGSTTTWNNARTGTPWKRAGGDFKALHTPTSISTAERGSQPGWWLFSGKGVLDLIEGWRIGRGENNDGLLLKLADEKSRICCIERRVEWESSAAANPAYKPYLSVNYILPAPPATKVTSPTDGTTTAKRFRLTASWDEPIVEGVTFQYRAGDAWLNIPADQVIDQENQTVTWPHGVDTVEDRENEPLYWDASSLLASGKIKIRAVLNGSPGASGFTNAVAAEVDQDLGGPKDATTPIGPGSVDLLTGNFTVSSTDVSIPGFESALEFSRSTSSRDINDRDEASVLGPGWRPSASVEAAGGSAWRGIRTFVEKEEIPGEEVCREVEEEEEICEEGPPVVITHRWARLTHTNGTQFNFKIEKAANKVDDIFVTPAEVKGSVLHRLSESQIAFTDPDSNRTAFSNFGAGDEYWPVSVSQPGGPESKTRMVYEIAGSKRRLTRVIAPTDDEIVCSDEQATTTQGCRVLGFTYAPATDWGAPSSLGKLLSRIIFYAPGQVASLPVVEYDYDSAGRLIEVTDPRTSLKEVYTYESTGQLKTLTPAGQESWTMSYGKITGDTSSGRLLSVKRASLVPSSPTAQSTIAYGVPITKSKGGPYEMSRQEVAKWGQEDLPTDATAIFPPDEVPAAPPSSYAHATVNYMDAEGQTVNIATPQGAGSSGPSISTLETDALGNVSRELTPENRLRALAAGANSAAKSKELDFQFKYSADGTKLVEQRGPVHAVRLETGPEAGAVVQARDYLSIQYDKGAPEPAPGGTWPLLPTAETTGALVGGKVLDQKTVVYEYDWSLRKLIKTIQDPEGSLKTQFTKRYDGDTGRVSETRQPSDAVTAGAGTTKISYYRWRSGYESEVPSECKSKLYAGLPCKIIPAAQPASGPNLPTTWYASYSALGKPTKVVEETTGSTPGTRTTTISYDSAGRPTSKQIQGGGTQIKKVELLYAATSGALTTQRFVCPILEPSCDKETITRTVDALGRMTGYQDADGNSATTTYNLNGQVVTFNDGKGTQSYGYDGATGLLVSLSDSMAGTFTASYDADGRMIKRGLPNGLTAETVYDATGAATDLTYTKASNCGTSCTWLDSAVARSAGGKILSEAGTLGTHQYSYDSLGRLTKAEEKPAGGGCTTRSYAFDKNSNRTSMTTSSPGIGGACSTSGGSSQSYSYDGADRLEAAGLIYDAFGRITTLPSAYAGGGNLETSYFSNDMIASQSQGGVTNTFTLDATLRQRQRVQGGGLEGTEIFHYADDSDSPAWTQLGGSWKRSITGIGGELVALSQSGSEPRLQLTNLHGDVVATASVNPANTELSMAARTDEFGKPISGTPSQFGWLGGAQRRTELPSGVIQMGARSYVPAMGRFLSRDPIAGGSANAYDYANADPVNQFDPTGLKPYGSACDAGAVGCQVKLEIWMWSPRGERMGVRMRWRTRRALGISLIKLEIHYWVDEPMDAYREGFVEMDPPTYLNNYPGLPASCRGTDPCADNHDARGTFGCRAGDQIRIRLTLKYRYNAGDQLEESQVLNAEAQQGCKYPY